MPFDYQCFVSLGGVKDAFCFSTSSRRDPAQLAAKAAEVSKRFNDCLPFIPLWQLDRHTVVHYNLKVFVDDTAEPVSPRLLNPTTLFQGVARWRLD